jgi:hypothetical protein
MRHVLLRLNSYMCLFDDTEFGKKDWRVQTRIGLTKSEINNAFSQLRRSRKIMSHRCTTRFRHCYPVAANLSVPHSLLALQYVEFRIGKLTDNDIILSVV